MITVKDKQFRPYIPKSEIDGINDRLAAELSRDYAGRDLVACPILTGAYMFAADLLRRLTIPCEVSLNASG